MIVVDFFFMQLPSFFVWKICYSNDDPSLLFHQKMTCHCRRFTASILTEYVFRWTPLKMLWQNSRLGHRAKCSGTRWTCGKEPQGIRGKSIIQKEILFDLHYRFGEALSNGECWKWCLVVFEVSTKKSNHSDENWKFVHCLENINT